MFTSTVVDMVCYTVGSYTFVVADPKLKDLENNMWSSSSRIIVGEKGLQVESRIAKVVSARVY